VSGEVSKILVEKRAHRWNMARCWCASNQAEQGRPLNQLPGGFQGGPHAHRSGDPSSSDVENRCR